MMVQYVLASLTQITQHKTLVSNQLLDLHRQEKSSLPSSHTDAGNEDPVAVTKKKAKSTETAAKTWKPPKMTAKNNVVMRPMREWGGTEAPRGGNTKAEEESEVEELGSTRQTNHVSGSRQPGLVWTC